MDEGRQYIEFFRADVGPQARRILLPAAACVTFGAPLILFGTALRRLPFVFPGACLMMFGLVVGFFGMARLLREDRFLGVTAEGLVVGAGAGEPVVVAWGAVATIRADGGVVVVARGDGAGDVRFGDFSGDRAGTVAARLDEISRKRRFGLTT